MSMADVQMFVDEALRMTKFDHRHVLHIVGISFDANSFPMVVLPFMQHGDLLSYIRDEHNVSLLFGLFLKLICCCYLVLSVCHRRALFLYC